MTARLLIVGPQGSGKGTQGVRIAEAFGVPAVSTGDVFRANISEGTELGRVIGPMEWDSPEAIELVRTAMNTARTP